MGAFTPLGSAEQNSDAVRQSNAAAWFNSVEGLLVGIDDQPRMTAGNQGSAVLGFGATFGADVGVGNNGEIFIRGRAGQVGSDSTATGGTTAPAPAKFRITPAMLLVAIAAFLLLRK